MDLYEIRNELAMGKSIYDLNLTVTYYARVSTNISEQLHSLKNQIEYFQNFIKKQSNWIFYEGFIDEGLTGTSTTKREHFLQMIEDAKQNKFNLILTKEVSRFSRNTLDSLFFTRELLKFNVGVFFINDNINTLLNESEFKLTLISSMAQVESEKISQRVKFGQKRSVEKGKLLGNDRIWGYNKLNGKLVINEEESIMIKEIFNLYIQNYGFRKISNMLLEQGYTNANGNPFNFSSLRNIIANQKYKGYYVGNKSVTLDYITKKRKAHDKSQWLIYKDEENIPPIVSEEIWNKANFILKNKSEKMSSEDKTSYQNKFLYSGKIICATHNKTYWRNILKYPTCEKEIWQCKVYRQNGKKGCNNFSIYKHELNIILKNTIDIFLNNKNEIIDKMLEMYSEVLNDTNYIKNINEINNKLEAIKKRKTKLLDLCVGEMITNEEFKERNEEFITETEMLKKELQQYKDLDEGKENAQYQLLNLKKSLTQELRCDNECTEKLIEYFLDYIKIYDTGMDNFIVMDIVLKLGINVPVGYLVKKDMRLLPSIHIGDNKRTYTFNRTLNGAKSTATTITIQVNIHLQLT